MQIEIYDMSATESGVQISLTAVCDSFSSLLWDVQYYGCGSFEIYIAATPQNLAAFMPGRIVGRDDDKEHYGIIETIKLETYAENGDYLTVTGRFLMSLLSRRIIYPTLSFTSLTSYADIVRMAVYQNAMKSGNRLIPSLCQGNATGNCWEKKARLQVSYDNLMEWIYKICEITGGTANIRLEEISSGNYAFFFDLSQGTDRSIFQEENAHIVFSDSYCNLLTFDYSADYSSQRNTAYVFGEGEGAERKRTITYSGTEPVHLDRYEVYVDAKDIKQESQENGETVQISDDEYIALLNEKGAEHFVYPTEITESTIAVDGKQYQYNKDYFVGDYVTVEHHRFGLIQPKIQLIGMIECYDQNGRTLTPTFRTGA
ncbi:MAG: siphovirus ReqiPepy6 Gp37-like family protein [Ruminococcus sp.]|nr:siphovirus ReqiPepy6 Gp37-like family protein [Ruminococcus sp.]